jgi:hypothetical protein
MSENPVPSKPADHEKSPAHAVLERLAFTTVRIDCDHGVEQASSSTPRRRIRRYLYL